VATPLFDHFPKTSLSAACRQLGITPRAFRFYEERGMVVASRNMLNHRLVDGATFHRLDWIVRLRRVGLTIHEVHGLLEAQDKGRDHRNLTLKRLEARRRRLLQQLAAVDALADGLSATSPDARPHLRQVSS